MRLVVLLIALLGALLQLTHGYEYGCTYTSPSRDYYDLSALSHCNGNGYNVATNDGSFNINICNNVQGCGGNSAVCQDNQYNAGQAASVAFSPYQGSQKGVVLTYSQGDNCPNNNKRKTVFTFICTPSADQPVFSFESEKPECTYNFIVKSKEACPKPVAPQIELCMVDVFLVPHTHDDVGWLLTIEGYYESAVKSILDTTVAALIANPERKFIYVEQAYFNRWWNDPSTTTQQRDNLRKLYNNGQWEFVLGGWVMQDEACTTYGADVDQMTLGHQFLYNTFGAKPTKGWQVDPFGASSVTPVLEKLSGFDAHLIDRITNKNVYESSQRLEFIWQGVPSLGEKGQIFTEIMGGGGYCDWLLAFNFANDPVTPQNVATYGKQFVDMVNGRTAWYKTPNLLAEWGCDFAFQNATAMFHSMDQLVHWLQQNVNRTRINVKYTTLSEYYDAVWKYKDVEYPVNQGGDFFPYDMDLWWTGYYTSRVQLKGYVRRGEAAAHGAEQLYSIGRVSKQFDSAKAYDALYKLRVANGDAQHHDGVTGTSVPEVVLMYQNDLIDGMTAALGSVADIMNLVIQKGNTAATLVPGTDNVLNLKTGQTAVVVVYNSLGWTQTQAVVLPVNTTNIVVQNSDLDTINAQITPAVGGNITSKYHLFFIAKVAPLGFTTFYVSAPAEEVEASQTELVVHKPVKAPQDTVLKNSLLQVTISAATGRINSIVNLKSNLTLPVDQNINEYVSLHSGAYAFGPAGPSYPVSSSPPTAEVSVGKVVSEVLQTFKNSESPTSYAKQTIRLYSADGNPDVEGFLEIIFDLGPLPSHRELVALFKTPISTNGVFTSDDNGFAFLEREYQWGTGIESNYYPMVYASYINDEYSQLTLISERSHGASSQMNGQLEVMVHRNPDMGDGFGPGLTDTTEVYPALRVLVDTPVNSREGLHKHSYLMNFPLTVYSAVATNAADWRNDFTETDQFLSEDLPSNVHMLSLNALSSSTQDVVVRFTHLYAVNEHPVYSAPVTIDVAKLFSNFQITNFSEVSLTGTTVLGTPSTTIELQPKDIRSFTLQLAKK